MKKIVIILSFIILGTTFFGCSQDDLLEAENRNQLSAQNFWKTQRDAEAGIYSVYSSLQFNGVLGSTAVLAAALQSEHGRVGNIGRRPNSLEFDNALVNSTNGDVFAQWEDLYKVVFRANAVLANVPNIEMDETVKREILGEAYFLRGLAMFWIANGFNGGAVPYPIVLPESLEETRFSIEDRDVVYSQIIEDLTMAQTNLVERLNWTSEGQEGRATWGAATSILGKVYLYEENFTRAAEEFKKVIDSGEYQLVDDIAQNFNEEGEFNEESIFEVQFFVSDPISGGNFGDGEGDNPNESTLRPTSWTRNGGFGFMFVTHFTSSLYRNEVVDPSLPINTSMPQEVYDENSELEETITPRIRSLRSEASMAYEDDGSIFYTTSTRENFIRMLSRGQVRKFHNHTLETEPRNSGINEQVIRYADVLLMYAEALLRGQGDAGVTEALTYINQVRQRSGLVTLETLFAGVPTSPIILNTFSDLRPDVGDTAPEAQAKIDQITAINDGLDPTLKIEPQALTADNIVLHLFNKERPAEFAWEGRGISWQDLRRRPGGPAARFVELGNVRYTSTTLDVQAFEELPEFVENSLQDFMLRKVNFGPEDLYYPLPSQEIIQNPLLNN
ncbi:RagB/SusD family nutrient uptake outer membrane protein [Aquimarina algiphila]|uniref:RagB/SusD family nutrient uptake outer membrane protein n=1 Tax=Aquimarina algiphila TaxID=2047982 RepID=A0A554VQK7_9FLAO|nr:RagB/SusD family nutrient uptake outer membrane protein [Aquimarina algiphila]TSE10768.1 RagB/SusD family nutrient uptake outer membrane protein [Aquimarina algiphila]